MTPAGLLAVLLAAPAEPPGTVVDVVHFAPAGPVRIRVSVRIDGQPAEAVWATAVDRLFAVADRGGDGTLDEKERSPFVGRTRPDEDAGPLRPLRLTFPRGEDRVSKDAFRAAVKAAGRGPLTTTATAGRADSDRLTDALFRSLDADRDGRLTTAELKNARERLAAMDADDDECISDQELMQRPPATRTTPVPAAMMQPDDADAATDYLFLSGPPSAHVKQILTARGGERATALKRTEFGADADTFAALDQDKNGKLDTDELAAWLARPADGTITLDLATPTAGGPVLERPGLSVRLAPPVGPAAARRAWEETAAPVRAVAPVERKTITGQPGLLALFDLADRNADGKLDAAERDAALSALTAVAACRAEVTFADAGRGLFERLDANADGRLSPRELAGASGLGVVDRKSMPRRVVVRAAAAGLLTAAPTAPSPTAPAGGPDWFAKMDRNGDGDVSRREFLGPLARFDQLDADGDGLLSPAEAGR